MLIIISKDFIIERLGNSSTLRCPDKNRGFRASQQFWKKGGLESQSFSLFHFPDASLHVFSQIFIFFQILTSHLSRQPSTSSTGSCRHDEVPTCHHPLPKIHNIFALQTKAWLSVIFLYYNPNWSLSRHLPSASPRVLSSQRLKKANHLYGTVPSNWNTQTTCLTTANLQNPKWLVLIRFFQKSWNFGSSGGPSTRRGSLLRFLQAESHRNINLET